MKEVRHFVVGIQSLGKCHTYTYERPGPSHLVRITLRPGSPFLLASVKNHGTGWEAVFRLKADQKEPQELEAVAIVAEEVPDPKELN